MAGCDGRSDQEKVQGKWEVWKMNGHFDFDLRPLSMDAREVLTFDGNKFSYTNNPISDISGAFVCDPTKSPKQITFTWGDRTIVAIYAFSGSDLKVCVGNNDATPPATFAGGPDERPALIFFRRPNPE
jgi:uncharacterized protein (TIGR03067 family)